MIIVTVTIVGSFLRGLFPNPWQPCPWRCVMCCWESTWLSSNMLVSAPDDSRHDQLTRHETTLIKWNSASPWSEMQLSPLNALDDSTLPQLINKGFAKLMWLVLLGLRGRVMGYCIKNYYIVSRQARKRTTMYAAEMLKKTKDKKTTNAFVDRLF